MSKRRTITRGMTSIFLALTYAYLVPVPSFAQADPADEETAYYRSNHYIPLKGEQDSDYPRGVYLVTDDIVIKKGRTMTFLPGTLVLFKKDARITVDGRLICQGNPDATITFGRLANDKYLIPLDQSVDARWDGIFVADSGSAEISYTYITGSKYGLENNRTDGTILLDSVMFKDNKFQDLKIGGRLVRVPEDRFVFYSSKTNTTGGQAKIAGGRNSGENKNHANWKIPLRIGFGAIAIAGGAAYWAGWNIASDNQKKSDNATNSNDAIDFSNKAKNAALWGNASGIIALIGATGFAVTFFF